MTDNQQTDNQQDNQRTDSAPTAPVVLQVWRDGGGVFALFPASPSDRVTK
jgi:hypothetical protein